MHACYTEVAKLNANSGLFSLTHQHLIPQRSPHHSQQAPLNLLRDPHLFPHLPITRASSNALMTQNGVVLVTLPSLSLQKTFVLQAMLFQRQLRVVQPFETALRPHHAHA